MSSKIKKCLIISIILVILLTITTVVVLAAIMDKPIMTAVPMPSDNNMKLEWSMKDSENNGFKVYQKRPDTTEFQTISTIDLESDTEAVNVLNVYPEGAPNVVFTYKDGTTAVLPKSASLKVWMEGGTMNENGTISNFDNYGRNPENGNQVIKVMEMSNADFNINPDIVWNYDVIMIGTWNENNNKYLDTNTTNIVKDYINAGYGVLTGHDTMGYKWGSTQGISSLRNLFNIKIGTWIGSSNGYDISARFGYESSKVQIKKEGLFTRFPWKIGKIGTKLDIPGTHTTSNVAYGDIWLELTDGEYIYDGPCPDKTGNDKYYLTTWGNTAMIQTGHSGCNSTEDERKIIANVLFYLKQRTTKTYSIDNSGTDVAAPNKVQNTSYAYDNNTGAINLTIEEPQDEGSTYNYYVEAINRDGSKINSDIIDSTITSGIKGYSYVIDNNTATEPDAQIDTTKKIIPISITDWSKPSYMHIRAVDNAENISEVSHVKIEDTIEPVITVTPNTTEWTKENVTLDYSASDEQSAIAKIILPDNAEVTTATGTYEVTENGAYTFTAVDIAGNSKEVSVEVTNIDKNAPNEFEITYTTDMTGYTIRASATDDLSGIDYYEYTINGDTYKIDKDGPQKEITNLQPGATYEVAVAVRAYDKVGNVLEISKALSITIESGIYTYNYTGKYQTFIVPKSGYYKMETWGGRGASDEHVFGYGYEGLGGYSVGDCYLEKDTELYVYIGQAGIWSPNSAIAWNGGGGTQGSGGGAASTDIRTVKTSAPNIWNETASLRSRIMVAGRWRRCYFIY